MIIQINGTFVDITFENREPTYIFMGCDSVSDYKSMLDTVKEYLKGAGWDVCFGKLEDIYDEDHEDAEYMGTGAHIVVNKTEEEFVNCDICHNCTKTNTAHLHQGKWMGECCWDERLRTTE